ncbi:timeless-domain-containing protein [Coleophoma cylindrospora]|uniref:Topoisomerase 1-associated factor 1 n=1 Tax=Coleophoma cylindrospora TaxID=1849047 RepID=A0A3D8STS5_9HELO|nr:timeless-domain-containing protein [Coleophoma cylindrospora]
MEFANGVKDVVDPEVRAYVSSLVTALGGSGADENGQYVLGDDALACLRDLKKWLRLYDEKAKRLDVARCLAESNLVGGDLLQILAAWPENATDDKMKAKIALACLELLVPLTWPIEKNLAQMTVNHHRHIPYLEIAQLGYKRSIINFDGARILNTAVRCALPSMAQSPKERSTRDEGIIKIVLYFLRNMALIAPPPNVKYDGDEADISRSATIDAFDYQDIFHLLLMMCSTMGEDFNTQDVMVMDILFHLVKGVDIEKLFMTETQLGNSQTDELVELRQKEAALLRGYQKSAPSRHNRFGAMAWISRENSKKTAISGQSAMTDATKGLAKMDSTKKFKPPRRAQKGYSGPMDFDTPVTLSPTATKHLRSFVEDFIDSGFNPLFSHIRKAIDREAERVLEIHSRQFFYLVGWFLEAERVRRKTKAATRSKSAAASDVESFSLVAGVLNQEMFVTLNKAMDTAYENKVWNDLSASMRCFTQILLTVQEMSECPLEDDQDIAENILSRIFYEETTHDRVANITRTYKDQGFGYLDACTELCHNYLRILEQYSKQNVDLQVRSKRRARRNKKAAKAAMYNEPDGDVIDELGNEDKARAEQASRERKFDFKRFAARFLVQGCVDTFIAFTHFYNDLKPSQLKRAHRYFYRVAFKQEMSVMLFRVDIIALFYKMIKGPESLDSSLPSFKEWNDLVKQLIKKCTRKMEERPELVVEMLFSKISSTAHFLEYGYDRQTVTSKPRAAAELEVRPTMDWDKQIGIVVSAMLDKNEGDLLQFVKSQLSSVESERRSWEEANKAVQSVEDDPFAEENTMVEALKPQPSSHVVRPDDARRKIAIFKNGYLRLLMKLVGFELGGVDDDPDGTWIIPSALSADQLKQSLDLINQNEFSPPTFDDGKEASDFIKRVSSGGPRKREAFDDESDNGIDDDEEPLFPAGGPTAMKKSDALDALKKNRRLRRKRSNDDDEDGGLLDEQLQARAEARRARELEKNRKIKSELYVHDSADEDDEERDRLFFEQEEKLRQRSNIIIMKELLGLNKSKDKASDEQSKKRKSTSLLDEESDDDLGVIPTRKRQSSVISIESGNEGSSSSSAAENNEDSENEATDTPLSSPHLKSSQSKRQKLSGNDGDAQSAKGLATDKENEPAGVLDEDDDEEDMPVARPARQRIRAGFVMDSSDEE